MFHEMQTKQCYDTCWEESEWRIDACGYRQGDKKMQTKAKA